MLSSLDSKFAWLDHSYFLLRNKILNKDEPLMFAKGWGEDAAIRSVIAQFEAISACDSLPFPIHIAWDESVERKDGLIERSGQFTAPFYRHFLPKECHTVHLKLISPEPLSPSLPVVLHLPTTREEGFKGRERTATSLAKKGIACMMLEGAFLGKRRPLSQESPMLRHLSDFFLLCGSAIEEARSVMHWLRMFGTRHILVAGVSKGGYIANAAGSTMPFPVGIASVVPPHSGTDVFLDGITQKLCDWEALKKTAPIGRNIDDHLRHLFDSTSISKIKPRSPSPMIVVGAHNDKYVPQTAYLNLKKAWQHIELRWSTGGHVSTIAERKRLISAISDGLTLLTRTEKSPMAWSPTERDNS